MYCYINYILCIELIDINRNEHIINLRWYIKLYIILYIIKLYINRIYNIKLYNKLYVK